MDGVPKPDVEDFESCVLSEILELACLSFRDLAGLSIDKEEMLYLAIHSLRASLLVDLNWGPS